MKQTLVILIINLIVLISEGSCEYNLCAKVVKFYSDGHKNYGIITIPKPGREVKIEIAIGIHTPNKDDASPGLVKHADRGLIVQYRLNFPQSKQLPYIKRITLNTKDICNGTKTALCTKNQKRVYLELGKHDISDQFEADFIPRISKRIIEHPEYVAGGAHGDVALIKIERVEFTLKISPVCLWAQGTSLDNVVQKGTVTGWGRMVNDGPSSTTPMKLNIQTVTLDKCREADKLLRTRHFVQVEKALDHAMAILEADSI